MNANELELKIQSLADGVLPLGEKESLLASLEGDASAKALYDEFVAVRQLLVPENELSRTLDEDGGFYWAGIAAGIERADREEPAAIAGPPWWLRWLVPALGLLALLAMPVGQMLKDSRTEVAQSVAEVRPVSNEVVAAVPVAAAEPLYAAAEVSTVNYFADAGEITVIWVNGDGLAYRP